MPLFWRLEYPEFIPCRLVTNKNPGRTITNSNLELTGGLIHLEAISQTFNVRKCTVLSKGNSLNTMYWDRKGSTTCNSPPAYLL